LPQNSVGFGYLGTGYLHFLCVMRWEKPGMTTLDILASTAVDEQKIADKWGER
jgi:hypothetical protein